MFFTVDEQVKVLLPFEGEGFVLHLLFLTPVLADLCICDYLLCREPGVYSECDVLSSMEVDEELLRLLLGQCRDIQFSSRVEVARDISSIRYRLKDQIETRTLRLNLFKQMSHRKKHCINKCLLCFLKNLRNIFLPKKPNIAPHLR